ncbi:DUF2023 family protein [Blastochloris sulfoviridis]|uniref:DUF2023 family protein n=1 Tax=Blastochloris sulfoviridis TaxID=50712 RepID=A0A5M6I1X1_9HYPH|nr:DUF2023 family protein [Blastochloris sulfoviridis]KAA5601825.1 DUF2023 family protein [Blastochloris sulfoviridis]
MDQPAGLTCATLQVFQHHLYELSKGLRPLAMMSLTADAAATIIARLTASGVAHHVHEACHERINVVFGRPAAVNAVQRFMVGPLCHLSAEHDFMLGILLGYDREQQCERYLTRAVATAGACSSKPAKAAKPADPAAQPEPVLMH